MENKNLLNYDFPEWVKLAFVAEAIQYTCRDCRLIIETLPEGVQQFIRDNPYEKAFEWADKLMKSAHDMPTKELELWVKNMSGGHFYRAEMRGLLGERHRNEK